MKLTLKTYGKTYSYESEQVTNPNGTCSMEPETIDDSMCVYIDLLKSSGYHEDTIDDWILEYAEEIRQDRENKNLKTSSTK